jgi:cyclic pyranopterin phosphate synthase
MERQEKRLHICLGTQCNNNCIFCMEDDRESRERRLKKIDSEAARRIMEQSESKEEVMFTAGEPTLRPDLLALVSHARKLGFQQIGIITNARRLAYRKYLEELVGGGINYILVSIHGHTAELHDGLTRTPGSFSQSVEGMANLAALKSSTLQLKFVTTTVVNKRNLRTLAEHFAFLERFRPDQVVFNCIQPVGRGERFFSILVPRYFEIVSHVAQALRHPAAASLAGRFYLLDLPRCVADGKLPDETLGFVERHRHFEPEGEVMDGLNGHRMAVPAPAGEGARFLTLVTKEGMDSLLRTHGPRCRECGFFDSCEGIWKNYASVFGFDEFVPLSRTESAHE